jgi:hypothetical protein
MGYMASNSRKNNSQKRPQTAKPKRNLGLQHNKSKKFNNYVAPSFGKQISSTPNNRVKSAKAGMGSLMGHVVPQ